MAFPGSRPTRILYGTAKRVVDELGKGQEVLRKAHGRVRGMSASEARSVIYIPDVDIVIVDVAVIGEGCTAGDICNVIVDDEFSHAVGAANRLVTEMTNANMADDTVFHATLANLNNNRVAAGQPIILVGEEVGGDTVTEIFVEISYILADEERSYRSYG